MGRDNGDPLNTLKPQPGQYGSYVQEFHPLPGPWAQKQLNSEPIGSIQNARYRDDVGPTGDLKRALSEERSQHKKWEEWQGVFPGEPIYENPRELQNTLLPSAKYGTEGQGYGS